MHSNVSGKDVNCMRLHSTPVGVTGDGFVVVRVCYTIRHDVAFGSTIGHWAKFLGEDTAEMVKELGIFADRVQYRLMLVRVLPDDVQKPQ